LLTVVNQLKLQHTLYASGCFDEISEQYHQYLYKRGEMSLFSTASGEIFEGKISHVNSDGKLVIVINNIGQREFGIKEISFLNY
ncbi:hypothetical protein RZS08_39345, partial [Arthrospira platensis SPKY1]|nr:hypothetical protein [Arthrospira platensis SPKY1]